MAKQTEVFQLDALRVVVLQSSYIETATVVVAPLIPRAELNRPITRLMPEIELHGELFIVDTPNLAAIKSSLLKTRVGEAFAYRDNLLAALDLLFTGF